MTTTVFRKADWVVAFNETEHRHSYLRDVDLVIDDDKIAFLGKDYSGKFDVEVDCRDRVLLPGFVNIHSHPSSEPLRKGLTDETRSPGFWHSSLYEFLPVFRNDHEGMIASTQAALAELLMSGVTTVVDLSIPYEGWLDVLGESGLRAVAAPMFRDARWLTKNGHELSYQWDTNEGQKSFDDARQVINLANQHPSGRLTGMVCPAQIDTCSASLINDAHDYATEYNLPFQIHAAQSVNEFHEIYRRHGKTPIAWLEGLGVLNDRAIIGHGIFLDHHPWLHWTTRRDLSILADHATTVAHCPTVFMRRGIALHTFGGYTRAGINMGIGTDTYPHNFIEEMRNTLTIARAVAQTVDDLETRDVYNASTLGGAKALQRSDIGRLAVGAKADFIVLDARHPAMMPLREPIRSLVYVAAERPVKDVYVDGQIVVRDGTTLNIDYAAASAALEEAQKRAMKGTAQLDWAGRSADELAPLVFSVERQ
ncbi:MAG: amidohydrolase family protein [Pseudomonadota bacterium]